MLYSDAPRRNVTPGGKGPMPLSWNEIRSNALSFSKNWTEVARERSESQTFWNEFFEIFGIKRRVYAAFEEPVKKLSGKWGFIDLFWPSVMLAEQKSLGKDLGKAESQAFEYIRELKNGGRGNEAPKYIVVSDFARIALHNLEPSEGEDGYFEFPLHELHQHIHRFAFIPGYKRHVYKEQDPINIKAVEILGKLHDELRDGGYTGHELERFMVRVLFCLFAEDTGIFDRDAFLLFILNKTSPDGSDLGIRLAQFFGVLNKPVSGRQKNLDEELKDLPYVNGDLFSEQLGFAAFNRKMRDALITCSRFDWSKISPAIFGSLFQSIMTPKDRRQIGAHYTSEGDILKLIGPLFLDDLRNEFNRIKRNGSSKTKLNNFRKKLCALKFLDPACGCGNFLVITYRELRLLELDALKEEFSTQQELRLTDKLTLSQVDVDQLYGIEVQEWPAQIAEVALWLMDHQMNLVVSETFGQLFQRLPLKKSPHIHVANALRVDWSEVLPAEQCNFVLGNPPFVGHQWRTKEQQSDMAYIWGKRGQVNRLDYVTCWFKKAQSYTSEAQTTDIAFVSTNSITQGEQCGILWPELFSKGLVIRFAHRTFAWASEARGKAAVHCVITGLTYKKTPQCRIFEYTTLKGDPHAAKVSRINGYLIEGPQYTVPARSKPIDGRLKMHKGSQPTDGARLKKPQGGYLKFSNLILDDEDKRALLQEDPSAKKWIKPYVGSDELISGEWRWCLWLKDADPKAIKRSKPIQQRLKRVTAGRLQSPTPSVQRYAKYPTLFTQDRQPSSRYLAVPEVSSERREYIPIAILPPSIIASNKLQIIPNAPLYYFAILTSSMHMAWMRTVTGRLESRYSYSPAVYNSFPWPSMTEKQREKLELLSKNVLDIRSSYENTSLEILYDPTSMPPKLRKAHETLDKAVDSLYRKKPFVYERERVEYLFSLYEKLSEPLNSKKK